jgi:hypothetical protein
MGQHRAKRSYTETVAASPRFHPAEALRLSPPVMSLLSLNGLDTIEDVLRWRRYGGGSGLDVQRIEEIDRALARVGLFRADPVPTRDWTIYRLRKQGATFGQLADRFQVTPSGARVVYHRVERALATETRMRAVNRGHTDISVNDLPLPARAKFALQRFNIHTLGTLLAAPIEKLLQASGVGNATVQAIKEVQAFYGRQLMTYRE